MLVVENESAKPHVAIMSSPGMGHITPLLEIAKRLVVRHDFHVSFIVIATNEVSAGQDNLLRSSILPPGLDVVYLPTVDVFAVTTNGMPVAARLSVIVEEAIKSLKSVLVELGKIKAVVIDLFCTQVFDICSELSIPAYLFFTASVALLTFSLYLPTLDREVEGEFVDSQNLLRSQVPFGSTGIFLNSWEDLEPANFKAITEDPFFKRIHTPPVHPVGPLIKQEEPLTASDADCLAWLDKQPPNSVLFVSLGSGEEIGIAIKPAAEPGASLVGREEVERVARLAILEGKDMMKKIRELKDSAARTMEIGGSSYDSLACLAKEWKS
ncbi:hypothetical protein DKX38_020645 [Salix brachista]|uniref:UDP-glycosyltransferases domain-containing protein n=1 Tax=Salix brachista TaxID=2182728 RepID=A0A5N5K5Y7_9ROSI|nr:hypothetical protein DKX38_020645 [Salix brachista]